MAQGGGQQGSTDQNTIAPTSRPSKPCGTASSSATIVGSGHRFVGVSTISSTSLIVGVGKLARQPSGRRPDQFEASARMFFDTIVRSVVSEQSPRSGRFKLPISLDQPLLAIGFPADRSHQKVKISARAAHALLKVST